MNKRAKNDAYKKLSDIRLFLIDLDGTVYIEGKLIPGVHGFINSLNRLGIHFLFITNNSSRNASQYVHKLNKLGISVTEKNILTSGQATGAYISKKKNNARLFVIGTSSLKNELETYGLRIEEDPDKEIDYVVVGFDTELTYQKLKAACYILSCDSTGFVATNPDLVCPVDKKRFIPDCGSICNILENATGRQPIFIGKPHTTMINLVRSRFNVTADKIAVIGDRLYTDIALGYNAGIMTICVLSGEATLQEISKSPFKPDVVIPKISDLNPQIEKMSKETTYNIR
ncbi:MAG: HAD-IIA family hydrolase [Fibrobacter sp.]|nr:HAD-IIA family hydrolase [Fibrobacter sp.]